jgi:hypothetical protein
MVEIEIGSPLSVGEVTQRLHRLLSGTRDVTGQHPALSGHVTQSGIEVMRTQRFGNSAFRPQFSGVVKSTSFGTSIVGSFGISKRAKSFMRRWFFSVGAWLIGTIIVAWTAHIPILWYLPLGGVALLAIGAAFLHFAKSYYREDQQWLLKLLSDALDGNVGSKIVRG